MANYKLSPCCDLHAANRDTKSATQKYQQMFRILSHLRQNVFVFYWDFFVKGQHRKEKSENRDTRVGRYGLKALSQYFCDNDKSDDKKFL